MTDTPAFNPNAKSDAEAWEKTHKWNTTMSYLEGIWMDDPDNERAEQAHQAILAMGGSQLSQTIRPDIHIPVGSTVDGSGPTYVASNEIRTVSSTGGEKGMKPERYDLIPVEPLRKLAVLYGRGAEKYSAHNFRKGYDWSKSYAAMQRHFNLFWAGEDMDEEMQLPHLTCGVFHAFALMGFMEEHPEFDDRYKRDES